MRGEMAIALPTPEPLIKAFGLQPARLPKSVLKVNDDAAIGLGTVTPLIVAIGRERLLHIGPWEQEKHRQVS